MVQFQGPIPPLSANHGYEVVFQEGEDNSIIIETVFRHLVSEHGSHWMDRIHFYLLCVDSSSVDPSHRHGFNRSGPLRDINKDMFDRLNDLPLPLRKQSECHNLQDPADAPGGLVDNETGKRGIRYTVGEVIRRMDREYVQVYARYYYHGRAGAVWICHVNKQDGKWTVTKMEMRLIS